MCFVAFFSKNSKNILCKIGLKIRSNNWKCAIFECRRSLREWWVNVCQKNIVHDRVDMKQEPLIYLMVQIHVMLYIYSKFLTDKSRGKKVRWNLFTARVFFHSKIFIFSDLYCIQGCLKWIWLKCHILLHKKLEPNANGQICWIIKVSAHLRNFSNFLFIVYSIEGHLLVIFINSQLWQNVVAFHISIIDYAWISMMFDMCKTQQLKIFVDGTCFHNYF